MPDFGGFIATGSFGGGQDGFSGTFASDAGGPISNNPYGTGSPAASVYIGTNLGPPVPGSVFDPKAGRIANNTVAQLWSHTGEIIDQGSPSYLIGRYNANMISVADINKYMVDSARGPILKLLNSVSGEIRFDSNQSYKDYLDRSTSYLVPESILSNALSKMYSRPASAGEITNMENLINAGGSISSVQYALAHSQEGADRINSLFRDTLGRPLNPSDMFQ